MILREREKRKEASMKGWCVFLFLKARVFHRLFTSTLFGAETT